MNRLLQSWLDELRADGLHLSEEAGSGARENLGCVSLPSLEQVGVGELVTFLQSALEVRRELAAAQPFGPVTFYAWHDEMAGQLRFSTACCPSSALPFSAKVLLVHDPHLIVAAFVQSPFREGIPWNELGEVASEKTADAPRLGETLGLSVWAVELV